LVLVLGDQLDKHSAALEGFDAARDAVWMAEVDQEATHVWCHKKRIAFFLSAMRHFRIQLRDQGITVHYHELTPHRSQDRGPDFATILKEDVNELRPEKLVWVLPGDYRVHQELAKAACDLGVPLEIRPDTHFYGTPEEFADFADGRKSLVLETFYRSMRKKHNVLMEDDEPAGGKWNFDEENREPFRGDGPGHITGPHSFRPDRITAEVCDLVQHRFSDHPGSLDDFDLPVTHAQARTMLRDFVNRSLPLFGKYEDAMWAEEPFVYHSRLSAPLNVKLLNPRACVEKAVAAYEHGDAPINSVEGFVRQIIGWREFIRGVYWLHMPDYAQKNYLGHQAPIPGFFWDGETDMQCVRQSMKHVIRHGYAHHIHRLMVLGNLALLLGVHPRSFHEWHMAMYVDAVDWVSLPNALGMSQHADGGIVGTKPYASTGNYIHRMSNFCSGCKYDYRLAVGEEACPFTTLYWDFLDRHHKQFTSNRRMGIQMKHVNNKRQTRQMSEIRLAANRLKRQWCSEGRASGK
jgi:deoxyribodipyrimidine photolyase-related protein